MRQLVKRSVVLVTLLSMVLASADALAVRRLPSRGRLRAHARRAGRVRVSRTRARGGRRFLRATRRGRKHYARSYRRRHRSYARKSASPTSRPVASIPTERIVEIQSALIKAGYLRSPASGQYDAATVEAMKSFQLDNGLPATGLPSAQTLKRLGVSKTSNDGYAVPINKVSDQDKKPHPNP
jgi:murein L,D-transpeptidase YcbB/YkuD